MATMLIERALTNIWSTASLRAGWAAKHWVLRWVMRDFNQRQPEVWAKHDAAGERSDWLVEQARRGLNSRTINTRICHVVAMFRYFRDMGVNILNWRFATSLSRKETEPICRVFINERANRAGVGILQSDSVAVISVKLMFDCGLRITELWNFYTMWISATGWLVGFTGGRGKRRRCIASREVPR